MSTPSSRDAEVVRRAVTDRLEFVDIITKLNPQFCDPSLTRSTPEDEWTLPWLYFDALRNYLLLTCFDLLGQSKDFHDFPTWLQASSTQSERNDVCNRLSSTASPIEIANEIHKEYLSLYGTKRAFYRFINELLSDEKRNELLYSVSVRKFDPVKRVQLPNIDDPSQKLKFLFFIRNAYTHAATNTGSAAGGVFQGIDDAIMIDGVPTKGWRPIHSESKSSYALMYGVRDWPLVLRSCVESGLQSLSSG